MSDDIKKIEGKAYAKGYAAGRARLQRDIDAEVRRASERAEWIALYGSILQGVISSSGWQTDGKSWSSFDEYSDGAAKFTDQAIKRVRYRYG